MSKRFYLTTTLPYVNAPPHLGFALELVRADALARYHALLGEEVFLNTGTDEHGLKIYRRAIEEGVDPQVYVDQKSESFLHLIEALGIDEAYVHFIRTTDPHHKKAAQVFWERCQKNGDIEKRPYETKYCVGCELQKTESELTNGRCTLHPNLDIEVIEEENYFFLFSRYREKLLKFYEEHPDFVVPRHRLEEAKNFVAKAEDFSISRLKSKMLWGVPVPGDEEQVMYVWFDALVNYISTLGWPEDEVNFEKFWGREDAPSGLQIAGKDNLRQQAAMWQAMLISAGLPTSKQIIIHGFITSGGEKMSKSLGNVVDPFELIKEYGVDAVRYWLLREVNDFEDSDFTAERFKESYNAHLANGLGNLVARVLKMRDLYEVEAEVDPIDPDSLFSKEYLESFEIKKCLDEVWDRVARAEKFIQDHEPFKTIKLDEAKAKKDIALLLKEVGVIALMLQPFLPETARKILVALKEKQPIENLFPRK